jgi:hypothetical protein
LFDVTTWNEAHPEGGRFDGVRMMAMPEDAIAAHAATGRPPLRLVGQMGWEDGPSQS